MGETEAATTTGNAETGQRFRFRLVHLLYLTALLASALGTFGGVGLLLAVPMMGFWSFVFTGRSRPRLFLMGLATIGSLCVVGMCLMPAANVPRGAARRTECNSHLKQIGLALHNYDDTFGVLPPPYIADESGKPIHSWRVLILPFLEQQVLYDQYDFSEPWDGPHNRELLKQMPSVYGCPADERRQLSPVPYTSYVAVAGENTVWPIERSCTIKDIYTSGTILVVEAGGKRIPWMKPDDLSLPEAVQMLSSDDMETASGHVTEDFLYVSCWGRQVLLVDGAVRFLAQWPDAALISGLLTIDDEDGWPDEGFQGEPITFRRPKLGNWFRLALLLLIIVWPTPWVWLNPTSCVE